MPAVTPSVLGAQVKAARAKTRAGRPLAFRSYDGWEGPDELVVDDHTVTVKECRSDLAIREAMLDGKPDSLVMLVHAPDEVLAEDTLARCAKGRLLDLNPRDTLLNLSGAHAIDPRLLLHREVIDLLVQRWREDARITSSANVIECGRAFAFLLGRPELALETPDLVGLLLWSMEDGMAAIKDAPNALRMAFFDWLRETSGPALPLIEQALKESSQRLVSLGLVLGTVFATDGSSTDAGKGAAIRLEKYLGDVKVHSSAAHSWHRAARAVISHLDTKQQNDVLKDVDFWLDDLKAEELAESSEFSPKGFEIRLDALAAALQTARRSESQKSWDSLLAVESNVRGHWLASLNAPRLSLIRMALRLTKWLRLVPDGKHADQLGSLASKFLEDGAFVDWARQKLRRGDGRESLNKVYAGLLNKVDERREELNATFAGKLQKWMSNDFQDHGVIPIEMVIDQVLVPLARETKVLFLVMDGMNGAVFSELMTDLGQRGWHFMRSAQQGLPKPVIAALPSITAVSRAALFRGRLDAADTTTEIVNFREHPSLHRAIQSRAKPQLFLKPSLADESGAGLSSEVREAIIESDSKVVGVVINAVDDQLSTLGQLAVEWNVHQITWLKDLLDAAVVGERVVVLTSDHGHVPAKESDRSAQLKNAEGDRHRVAPPEPREGEMAFSGRRLQAATGKGEWIFSQSESLRYGGKKSGYHGGVADQEIIVPLAILSASPDPIADFESSDFNPPGWWNVESESISEGMPQVKLPLPGPRKKKPTTADSPSLELWAASGASVSGGAGTATVPAFGNELPSWLGHLLKSDVLSQQKALAGRTPLSDEMLSRTLAIIDSRAGVIQSVSLVRELGLPQFRVGGFVAQLQRLLNVEGYMVLENDASQTLRLNKDLLLKQFDIKP